MEFFCFSTKLLALLFCESVSPAAYEPIPGWVDNLNGPTGLMIGAGKGVIRSILIDTKKKGELIAVDYAINGLIVMPYIQDKEQEKQSEVPVYNVTSADHRKLQWGEVINMSKSINYDYPIDVGLWYPDPCITTNKTYHKFNVIMFHWLPAYFIDFLMLILGQKQFMIRIQNKVATGLGVLEFFTLNAWCFKSDRYAKLWQILTENDKKIFNMEMDSWNQEKYMISCAKGARQYILKESLETLPKARVHLKIMWLVDRLCKLIFIGVFCYWIIKVTGIIKLIA